MNPRLFKNKAYYPISVSGKIQEATSTEECKVSDQMRKEFEEWALKEGLPVEWLSDCGSYDARTTEIAWQACQASRKATVVELPCSVCRANQYHIEYTGELVTEHDEYYEIEDVKSALDAAGVSYK